MDVNNNKITIERDTLETQIKITVELDNITERGLHGTSGIGFFDHMLNSFAIHSTMSIYLDMTGDLNVDCHHTIEDVGIVLGKAIGEIVQKRKPIRRYGVAYIPMDEALTRSVIDISGRPYLVCDYSPNVPTVGEFDTQMVLEFFKAIAFNMNATLHLNVLSGQNDHHIIESLFKAFAHSLKDAIEKIDGADISAKGAL